MELTNRKGVGLMAIGMVMVALSLFFAIHYVMDEWRSGGYAASALTAIEEAGETADAVTANGETYVGRLTIPALEMEMPVMESYSLQNRKVGPSIYWTSQEGDAVVITGYGFQGHFAHLKKLAVGDSVTYQRLGGDEEAYTVAKIEILKPSQVEEMLSGEYPLTLFTSTTGGNSRLAVRCESAA